MNKRRQQILSIIQRNQPIGISQIKSLFTEKISVPTLNRELSKLRDENFLSIIGKGPSLKYNINLGGLSFAEIDIKEHFEIKIDERIVLEKFNRNVFKLFDGKNIFTESQINRLEKATEKFRIKINNLNQAAHKKEFERLMIELSWKSSEIEGNTYNLLDTEQLLKYNVISPLYSKEESTMLLNHKNAIQYTFFHSDEYKEIKINKIIEIHTLLIKDLGVSKNVRKRLVRIIGTKYQPPDNEFIIKEALEEMCTLINKRKNVFEKALLLVLLISYIQPFEDGNKRTARLSGNSILQAYGYCPLSYRSIAATDYKKAMLLFYELNNITAFKNIFVEQYLFATENYF